MKTNKSTIAIFGIQDRGYHKHPLFVHDHSIALYKNGSLIKFIQLERETRIKYDNSMTTSIYELLKKEGLIASEEYDVVFVDSVVGRSFISEKGDIRFEAPLANDLQNDAEKGYCWWFDKEIEGYALNHELAHIYSCLPFFGMFKENSLLVHFDGGASKSGFSAWKYQNNKLLKIESNWDLKYLSSFFNANALNFSIIGAKQRDQNSLPGKLMGFASHGTYDKKIEDWLKVNDYFEDIWSDKHYFFEKVKNDWGIELKVFNQKDPFIQNIAATFQYIFQRDFIKKLRGIKEKIKTEFLYLTGGSALNIVTNSKIIEEGIFKDVFIPPCTNDSGLAIGAGAFLEFKKHGYINIHSAYLNNWGIGDYEVDYSEKDIAEVANLLLEKKVIGVCNSFGEVGPRALGNRSIITLASDKSLAKKVSMTHKHREWYRPVAPIMLVKNIEYFTGHREVHHLSKYMLLDFKILPERREEIKGVVHVDGTSRIQCLFEKNDNPFMFDLLAYLDEKHSVKALINTSFNKKGEPIVHTKNDALKSAKEMDLDGIVLNGYFDRLNSLDKLNDRN